MRLCLLVCLGLVAMGCYDLDSLRRQDGGTVGDAAPVDAEPPDGEAACSAPLFAAGTLRGPGLPESGTIDFGDVFSARSVVPAVLLMVRASSPSVATRCIVSDIDVNQALYACKGLGYEPAEPTDVHWLAVEKGSHCGRGQLGATRRLVAGATDCGIDPLCEIDFGTPRPFTDASQVVVLLTIEWGVPKGPLAGRVDDVWTDGARVELPTGGATVHWIALERTYMDDLTMIGEPGSGYALRALTRPDIPALDFPYAYGPMLRSPASVLLTVFDVARTLTHYTARDATRATYLETALEIEQLDETGVRPNLTPGATVAVLVVGAL